MVVEWRRKMGRPSGGIVVETFGGKADMDRMKMILVIYDLVI